VYLLLIWLIIVALQNKEQKVAYLLKMMNVVSLVLGEVVPCDPYKVWRSILQNYILLFFCSTLLVCPSE
jgi:hypothetical protein